MPDQTPHSPARHRDPTVSPEERSWAMGMHLALLLHLTAVGILAAPVIVLLAWLAKKDRSPFLDDHGREALNFQITLFIYYTAAGLLAVPTLGLAMLLIPATYVLGLIGMILATKAAGRREYYRYPATLRFIH